MNYNQLYIENSKKLQSEEEFHDELACSISIENLSVFKSFEAVTAPENKFILKEFGDVSGKRLLDLGCGAGESSVYFALQGAEVTAIDVSEGMLKVTKKLAAKYNADIRVLKLPVERIAAMGESFDYVYGYGVLHHIDFKQSALGLSKILARGGKAAFIEPLTYNPIIDVYRKLAKDVRTPDERPLSFKDIEFFKKYFRKVQHREFWFFTLFIFVLFFLKGLHPSKVRYWKYVIEHGEEYRTLYRVLNFLDSIILRIFPFLRRFCWTTVIILEGPLNGEGNIQLA